MDFINTFYPASFFIHDPYSVVFFVNPPWTALILWPFRFFPVESARIVNGLILISVFIVLIIKRGGNFWSLLLTFTSFPFLATLSYGNIEWIIALAFIFANSWSLPLLVIKPQSGIFACIVWFRRSENKHMFFVPLAVVIILSFLFWGNWIIDIVANMRALKTLGLNTWNASPFPLFFSTGILLLAYLIFDKPPQAELIGVAAALCLSPYFAYQSLSVPFALFSASHKKSSLMIWLILWIIPFWNALRGA